MRRLDADCVMAVKHVDTDDTILKLFTDRCWGLKTDLHVVPADERSEVDCTLLCK